MSQRYLLKILRHFIIWTMAISFWTIMRRYGQETNPDYDPLSLENSVFAHIVVGFFSGILFGSLSIVYEKFIFRKMSFGSAVFVGSICYLFTTLVILTLGFLIYARLSPEYLEWADFKTWLVSKEVRLLIAYFFMIGVFVNFFGEIDKKFGEGNLWRTFKGEFYYPKENEKIFMFLDLVDSTALAEKLGHKKFSSLLQDCFKDLSVIERYRAEIYQFVGDEVVLTWSLKRGMLNQNCLKTYFAYQQRLVRRSKHYAKKYGVQPQFTAGLHMGIIVTAEVGELKREIAHHGDTINTASRIQDACKKFKEQFLISEHAKDQLSNNSSFKFSNKGLVKLKGKNVETKIYAVEKVMGNPT